MPLALAGPTELDLDAIAALLPAFEFHGVIARGATGTVYKARQRSLDRDVAIRVASRLNSADPAFRSSFGAMAKAMASLSHSGLIRVYDSGEVDGLPFVVMEYVTGKTLLHSSQGKAVETRQAVQIVIAACQGLAHAHGRGIAHGAIRPANILLTPKCEPKIGNFGFSLKDGQDGVDAYLAPELSNGSGAVSLQTDVYAIGSILTELLTGISAGAKQAVPVAIPDPKLAAICKKAAHPDPALRYADAGALAEALGQWLASPSPVRTPVRPQASPRRPMAPAVSRAPAATFKASRSNRGVVMNSAIIAVFLVVIHGLQGAYREQQDAFARIQKLEEARPRLTVTKAESVKEAPRGIDSWLVQLKP